MTRAYTKVCRNCGAYEMQTTTGTMLVTRSDVKIVKECDS